jgi:hypothetical protein
MWFNPADFGKAPDATNAISAIPAISEDKNSKTARIATPSIVIPDIENSKIAEIAILPESNTNRSITCRGCIHFESQHDHGGGAGTCKAEVMPYGACHWADTVHPCGKYQSRDQAETGKSSEAAHNAQGHYFKFLVIRQDGTQFYSCAMPRQTLAETWAQYPDATHIQPVEGEDYPND